MAGLFPNADNRHSRLAHKSRASITIGTRTRFFNRRALARRRHILRRQPVRIASSVFQILGHRPKFKAILQGRRIVRLVR